MKTVRLERLESGDQGTFGRIYFGKYIFFTGELPWRENKSDISCIPPGTYECEMTMSQHFRRKLYLVLNVENRFAIRIHSANLMGDKSKGFLCQLNGCIAVGEKSGRIDGQKAMLVSAPAVRKLEEYLEKKPFTLEILNVYDAN